MGYAVSYNSTMDIDWVLAIRLAVGASGAFLAGVTLMVVINYYKAWMRHPRTEPWHGLLPFHVLTVSLSYDLLLVYATINALIRTEEGGPLSIWRLCMVVPAIVLGFLAMYVMTKLRIRGGLKEDI